MKLQDVAKVISTVQITGSAYDKTQQRSRNNEQNCCNSHDHERAGDNPAASRT